MLQVVEDVRDVRMTEEGRPLESTLTEGLSHPGLCKLLAHKTAPTQQHRRASYDNLGSAAAGSSAPDADPRRCRSQDGGPDKRAPADHELWLILEYCDKGCVQARHPLPLARSSDALCPGTGRSTCCIFLKWGCACAQDAVDKGWFRSRPSIDAPPCLPVILTTAQQIASAMAYLHAKGIIHGDLTGGRAALLASHVSCCCSFQHMHPT